MSQKKFPKVLIWVGVFVVCLAGIYFGFSVYYQKRFAYGTTINGVYCTGKGIDAINNELIHNYSYHGITVVGKNEESYFLDSKDFDFSVDYKEEIQRIKKEQNPYLWFERVLNKSEYEIEPSISFDEDKLKENFMNLDFFAGDIYDESNKSEIIRTTDRGFVLKDRTKDLIVPDVAYDYVLEAVKNTETEVNLWEAGAYDSIPENKANSDTDTLYAKLNNFQDFKATFEFIDGTEVIDASVTATWIKRDEAGQIVFDEEGNPCVDEEKMKNSFNRMISKHETVNKKRNFKTTAGDEIVLEPGLYGTDVDEDKEFVWLKEAFAKGYTNRVRTPEYKEIAWGEGEDDIGDTYVEVDVDNQMLYYYQDGELMIETEVVTGNAARKCNTPRKICYVYYKQRNRVLHGPNYATFVYYWMAVNGNIGLHDATWRRKFGGEIYKTDGSHGCVNMPKAKAAELYDIIELGTPVIIF